MKREKELAERRKNEPKLDQNQDHLVRKIFSRFRKGGSNSSSNLLSSTSAQSSGNVPGGLGLSNGPCGGGSQSGTPSHGARDVERGELFQQTSGEDSLGSPRREKMLAIGGKSSLEELGQPASRAGSAKSKWGRMMRGNSGSLEVSETPGMTDPQSMQSLLSGHKSSGGTSAISGGGGTNNPQQQTGQNNKEPRVGSGSGNRVYPKLSRVPERQESQEEPYHHHQQQQHPASTSAEKMSRLKTIDYHPPPPSPGGGSLLPPSAGDHSGGSDHQRHEDIIESFAELKHQVHSEVQRINHKMSRLEDILGEILVRLTPQQQAAPVTHQSRSGSRSRSNTAPTGTPGVITQVAPVTADSSTSSASPFLVVSSASLVDEGAGSGSRSPGGRKSHTSKGRPRSAGNDSSKLVTQFNEYL